MKPELPSPEGSAAAEERWQEQGQEQEGAQKPAQTLAPIEAEPGENCDCSL